MGQMTVIPATCQMRDDEGRTVTGLEAAIQLETWGIHISRYGLVLVLVSIGGLKFTAAEARGIEPLVLHSPLLSWLIGALGVQGVSNVIGMIELTLAALIAMRPFAPAVSLTGSVGASVMFAITLSFLFSTPGAIALLGWVPVFRRGRSVFDQRRCAPRGVIAHGGGGVAGLAVRRRSSTDVTQAVRLSLQTASAGCVAFGDGLRARFRANRTMDEGAAGLVIELAFCGDGDERRRRQGRWLAVTGSKRLQSSR